MRKRYSTYMCFDTKIGSVSNMLLTLPGRFDPNKLMVFGFSLSPDRKHALMNVSSPSGSSLGGLWMVDLVKMKANKFPPTGGTWVGNNELVVSVKDGLSRYTQLARYSVAGARLGTLPICGEIIAADEEGKYLYVKANPDKLNKPLSAEDYKTAVKLLIVDKQGKVVFEVASPPNGNMSVLSPGLKFSNAQTAVNGQAAMKISSLDGKKEWVLPGMMKVVYVGDEGDVLSLTYSPTWGQTLEYSGADGKKLWTGPAVSMAAFYDGKAYYTESANPKVIKTKVLVEKKAAASQTSGP